MKKTLIFLFFLICTAGRAQVFPVQVNVQLTPPYSPYLSDYTVPGAQRFMVHIRPNDVALFNYACRLRITIEGVGITLRTKENFISQPIILEGGGIPRTLYGEDLHEYFHPDALDFSGFSRWEYQKSSRLPEGIYRFTVEVLDYNRGTVVSNKGMTMAWIILNDPPLLNVPANHSKIKLQDPVNILFSWTPRHTGSPNAAFTTEYTFRLVELWPENRNPYDAFLTQEPLYETATTQNQILYGMSEPPLLPGRKYAWQVEARTEEGKDLFKNNGRSEVFVFQYGDALAVPRNLQLRWAKPRTLAIRWDKVWTDYPEELKYRLAYRPRRRVPDHQWYETRTKFTDKTLYDLEPDTEYEVKVRTENSAQESEYTETQIFKTLAEEDEVFVCKDDITPPPPPDNTDPVFPLSVNDTIHAGGYAVLVRDVMKVENKYFGSGYAIVPWFNSAKVRVTFENIRVNDRFWLTSGTIRSVWNAQSEFLLEEQAPVLPGNAPQAGELDITVVSVDSLISVEGRAIASVTKDEEGNIVITTTDGEEQTLARGESYAVVDEVGNGYVVDKEGNIAKTTATEATAAATRGNRTYDLKFSFARGPGKFGFDEKQFEGLSQYYQQIDDGVYAGWKALSSGGPDQFEGRLESSEKIPVNALRFEAGSAAVAPTANQENIFTFSLQGKAAGMEEEFLALHQSSDTVPPKVLGKVNLVSYNPIRHNLVIVPVNNATTPAGLTAQDISEDLNRVFSQAVVEWNVQVHDGIDVPLDATLDEGEAGLFSNYTDDMKKVLKAFGRLQENTYYLFLIDEPRDPSTLGYMPRNKQAGFVFVKPHNGSAATFLKTIAHELGHGAFNLKHTFSEHPLPSGTTDNLMDYSPGTKLYKYQWDQVHQPQAVLGVFEEEGESAMAADLAKFESEFLHRIGGEIKSSDCWKQAIERGFNVYKRFDADVAFFAGFLRLMLCETEKENCAANGNLDPYACGLTNGLLQEVDWISMVEAIEGWSVDPEAILSCIIQSYPIDGGVDNNPPLQPIVFKCLTGVDFGDLSTAVKDLIIAHWDDPYYQGQATAFAMTLFTPFKGKIITKLENVPHYAAKLENLKLLAKAENSEELVGISKTMVNLVDESELDNFAKTVKFLPGPQLPLKIAEGFTESVYKNRKLLNTERYFKYHGVDNRTGKRYTWLVNKKYSTEKELREGLAIRHDWGVDIKYVSEFHVPAGTWVSEGTAASQGMGYPGGEYQAVILKVPKVWIVKTTEAF